MDLKSKLGIGLIVGGLIELTSLVSCNTYRYSQCPAYKSYSLNYIKSSENLAGCYNHIDERRLIK